MLGTIHENKNHFGVLRSQEDPDSNRAVKIPIRFEDIKKPTELEPVPAEMLNQKHNMHHAHSTAEKIEKKVEVVPEKFEAPKPLVAYVNKLISNGRKLRALGFDIEEATSVSEIKRVLDSKFEKGIINQAEKKEMLDFLSGLKIEVPEDVVESVVEAPEVLDNEHPIRARRKKIQKLKNNHGIVMDSGSVEFTPLENNILDRARLVWKGNNREIALTSFLLEGNALEYQKQPEISLISEPVISIPVPDITPKQEVVSEVVPKTVAEPEVIHIEKVEEKVPEKLIEKQPEVVEEKPIEKEIPAASAPQANVIPVEFEGKTIQIVRGEGGSLKVIFNEKEIALGVVNSKGVDIKIKKEFKAGFLFEATEEEKAFKEALKTIKTLK